MYVKEEKRYKKRYKKKIQKREKKRYKKDTRKHSTLTFPLMSGLLKNKFGALPKRFTEAHLGARKYFDSADNNAVEKEKDAGTEKKRIQYQ